MSQFNLGYCYYYGIGTSKDNKKGGHGGQFSLKSCYQYGIETTKDEKKTFQCWKHKRRTGEFQWYLKSAEAGNYLRRNNLGYFYVMEPQKMKQKHFRVLEVS
ncbi:hypothetical protein Glove_114g76 [Diversispora epigaea]|uniref:Uncharacterized protein n=1 Tax=Diversispora epigaea TaxID=1348612 RepID=A0A397JAW7_9GLOM|nr:hypothetical protein Glove_114g76 [Diversispora epigaea]